LVITSDDEPIITPSITLRSVSHANCVKDERSSRG
jgi:hypothetical protein